MIHLLIAVLAGCGQGDQPAEAPVETARSFQLIYQSNMAGEIEPCG
jgi:hypothetical protein